MLSDVGNKLAKQLGILHPQSESLRPLLAGQGVDWKKSYGEDEVLMVPLPATILVDKEGVVRNTFVDADYTKRLDPKEAVAWCDVL